VVARAGAGAPLSFVLAGLMAALTGLCYAELSARFPEAAGAAAYIKQAFGSDRLSQVTGLVVAAAGVVGAASIARGSVAYLQIFVALPDWILAIALVAGFTGLACLGVRQSVGISALMSALEIGGLLYVVAAGTPALLNAPPPLTALVPVEAAGWSGIAAGAFLAAFAFFGFENLVNMAEEAKDASRTMPKAIVLSIAVSALLYVAVSLVTIVAAPLAQLVASPVPLLLVVEKSGWGGMDQFALLAVVAVANGVLIHILMLGRLFYGMAGHGWLPGALSRVSPATRTPIRATLLAGALILVLALAAPLGPLASATSTLTLVLFALVGLGLWRLQRVAPAGAGRFPVPRWVPPATVAVNLALLAFEGFG